ncbi:MAG TPA: DegT/DnrJ/EryC1/StrS family aminotransferase [Pirellulales bacterium]|nr:DegT/DnrJ/EryC1/StrS family aminotransferase [Pirellulales bacterium]
MKSAASPADDATSKTKVSAVPLLDIQRQHAPLRAEIDAALARVCDSGRFILGPDCEELETRLAGYCQARHAVACASGSDALLLALMAGGIGPGDEVLLPSYTFFATAGAVWRLGARPVFVDIDPANFNISPTDAQRRVTPRTKAIIPVHLFGQCADMAAIGAIAQHHHLLLVEDAAQAIGAEFDGHRAGSLGHIGCFSFYPTKNLGGIGDGGMLTTQDQETAERLRLLRGHGMQPRYYHQTVGVNSRLDTLQAAVLNVKFPHLDRWSAQRQANAERYSALLSDGGLGRTLGLPSAPRRGKHVWNQYVVRVPGGKRDALREHLSRSGVGTEIYYPVPLHLQQCFKELGYAKGSLPESERAALETIALPIFPELTAAEQQFVVERIAEFLRSGVHGQPKPHLAPGNLTGTGDVARA